jgi:hypothetical protein
MPPICEADTSGVVGGRLMLTHPSYFPPPSLLKHRLLIRYSRENVTNRRQIQKSLVFRIPCTAGPSSNLNSAPREVFPTELTSDEEMYCRGTSANVLYECDGLSTRKYQINKKSGIMPPICETDTSGVVGGRLMLAHPSYFPPPSLLKHRLLIKYSRENETNRMPNKKSLRLKDSQARVRISTRHPQGGFSH